jgi:hypothetical protein
MKVVRNANWELAEHLLKVMLPGASRFSINGLGDTRGENWQFFDIEGRTASEGARDLVSRCAHLIGPLIVVNDASHKSGNGPHFVEASRLAAFAESFPDDFGSAFLSGTMFIVAPVTGDIVAVDDEQLIAHIKGRPAFTLTPHYSNGLSSQDK